MDRAASLCTDKPLVANMGVLATTVDTSIPSMIALSLACKYINTYQHISIIHHLLGEIHKLKNYDHKQVFFDNVTQMNW